MQAQGSESPSPAPTFKSWAWPHLLIIPKLYQVGRNRRMSGTCWLSAQSGDPDSGRGREQAYSQCTARHGVPAQGFTHSPTGGSEWPLGKEEQ